jgi:hypothetical protein
MSVTNSQSMIERDPFSRKFGQFHLIFKIPLYKIPLTLRNTFYTKNTLPKSEQHKSKTYQNIWEKTKLIKIFLEYQFNLVCSLS